MPIQSTDILWKYSIKTPISGGNSSPQPDPNQSLGGFISTTTWPGGVLDDLFDDITGAENSALTTDYRCVFIHNNHASLTLFSAVLFISNQNLTVGHAVPAIGIDPTPESIISSLSSQAVSVASETIAPAGVSFSAPMTQNDALVLGDIPAGHCRAAWVRRTAVNGPPVTNDGFTLKVIGETAA